MPELIHNEERLLAHLPNVISSVKGETPLYDKLEKFLDLSEDWVKSTFTPEDVFYEIGGDDVFVPIHKITARLVVAQAMLLAIPSLDIVLSPNGFAVVNTSNLAPASKPRVDRLVESFAVQRDNCIEALLANLTGLLYCDWDFTPQAVFFAATLFLDLDICNDLGIKEGCKWEKYLELRSQIIDIEASLADEWFSPELMRNLRSENLSKELSDKRKWVVEQIKSQIVACLRGGSFNQRRLSDIVNYIRKDKDSFKEWHCSETAKLFAPPVFRNKKNSSGYFF